MRSAALFSCTLSKNDNRKVPVRQTAPNYLARTPKSTKTAETSNKTSQHELICFQEKETLALPESPPMFVAPNRISTFRAMFSLPFRVYSLTLLGKKLTKVNKGKQQRAELLKNWTAARCSNSSKPICAGKGRSNPGRPTGSARAYRVAFPQDEAAESPGLQYMLLKHLFLRCFVPAITCKHTEVLLGKDGASLNSRRRITLRDVHGRERQLLDRAIPVARQGAARESGAHPDMETLGAPVLSNHSLEPYLRNQDCAFNRFRGQADLVALDSAAPADMPAQTFYHEPGNPKRSNNVEWVERELRIPVWLNTRSLQTRDVDYNIVAIVIHRGETHSPGHYQACLLDGPSENLINDNVTAKTLRQVDCRTISQNPYRIFCIQAE